MADTAMSQAVLEAAKNGITATQYTFLVGTSIVIWDWLVSLRNEYKAIWSRPLGLVSCLYIGCRYWTMVALTSCLWFYLGHHTASYCQKYYEWPPGLVWPVQFFSGSILLIRTYAFCGKSIYVAVGGAIMLATMMGYNLFVCLNGAVLVPFLEGDTGPCITSGGRSQPITYGFWLSPFLYTTILTGITLGRAIYLKRASPRSKPFIKMITETGLLFFSVTSTIDLITFGLYIQPNENIAGVTIALEIALVSLMANRLVLSLRLHRPSENNGISTSIFHKTGFRPEEPKTVPHGTGFEVDLENAGTTGRGIRMQTYPGVRMDTQQVTRVEGADDESDYKAQRLHFDTKA